MIPTLIVGNHLSASGDTPKVCEELACRLDLAGWPVMTSSHKPNPVARLADMLTTAWGRRESYEVAQVDVYSGRAFLWAEAITQTLQRCHRPYVLTLHGGALPDLVRTQPGRVRRLLTGAAAVTAPSRYLSAAVAPIRQGTKVIPNAIDLPRYPFRVRSNPAPRLIWLRAFHEIYNSILAVETLALLKREIPKLELAMIGPDRGDGSLKRTRSRSRELRLSGAVEFGGRTPKEQVPTALDQADVFVNTSFVDNTPVSVIEAMACGLCVVSTNVGGVPDLIDDGVNGLLVPPGNPTAMASAIRRLYYEPGLAARLSVNARQAVEQFDWSLVLPVWQKLFTKTVGLNR